MLPAVADTILWVTEIPSLTWMAEGAGTDPVPAVPAMMIRARVSLYIIIEWLRERGAERARERGRTISHRGRRNRRVGVWRWWIGER